MESAFFRHPPRRRTTQQEVMEEEKEGKNKKGQGLDLARLLKNIDELFRYFHRIEHDQLCPSRHGEKKKRKKEGNR